MSYLFPFYTEGLDSISCLTSLSTSISRVGSTVPLILILEQLTSFFSASRIALVW